MEEAAGTGKENSGAELEYVWLRGQTDKWCISMGGHGGELRVGRARKMGMH